MLTFSQAQDAGMMPRIVELRGGCISEEVVTGKRAGVSQFKGI